MDDSKSTPVDPPTPEVPVDPVDPGVPVVSTDYKATVKYTPYGVPHITAASYAELGAAVAYVQTKETACELFDRIKSASGTSAQYDGPGTSNANINNDLYYAWMRTKVNAWLAAPEGSVNSPSKNARDLMTGWVAGVNKYLSDVGGANGIPDSRCKGAAHIRPLTPDDAWMYSATIWATEGASTNMTGIVAAVPPAGAPGPNCSAAATTADTSSRLSRLMLALANSVKTTLGIKVPSQPTLMLARQADVPPGIDAKDADVQGSFGSNAFGIGKQATKNGGGMLLVNPHWFWSGPNRWYRMHLTIPGELNISGVSSLNVPMISIGYNENAGWSHTVSTALRTGFWGLQLDPTDSTKYLYEGKYEPMTVTCVSAKAKQPDGTMTETTRAFYTTKWGPVVRTTTLPWSTTKAYAGRDPSEGLRATDQYLAMAKAKSVDEIAAAMNKYAAIGTNTIAADRNGKAFYADIGHIPNVTNEQLSGASGSSPGACLDKDIGVTQWAAAGRTLVLDGSREACAWQTDPDGQPGLSGLKSSPHLFRDDYVTNSNDSYWLTNPNEPLEGYSKVYAPATGERTARSLRTRMGLKLVTDRMAGADGLGNPGFDLDTLKRAMFSNQALSAEMGKFALVRKCKAVGYTWNGVDLTTACNTLESWDGRYNTYSRGAHIWRQFVNANPTGLVWSVPFDANAAATTPNTLNADAAAVMNALATAVTQLNNANIPLTATLGEVQGLTRNGVRYPYPGDSSGATGVFNIVPSVGNLTANTGWAVNGAGSGGSIIMAIEFPPNGPPKGAAVLTYSQSTNPDSPHYADQTALVSRGEWDTAYFTEAEIDAAAVETVQLSIPR